MSGVCKALGWLISQAEGKPPPLPPAVICYDSEYAAMQTQGLWRAKKNKALVQRAQAALAEARRSREVRSALEELHTDRLTPAPVGRAP